MTAPNIAELAEAARQAVDEAFRTTESAAHDLAGAMIRNQAYDDRNDAFEAIKALALAADRALAGVEATEGQQWMPIETAPKDGTEIILGYISGHAAISGHSESGYWMGDPGRNHWGRTGWFATSDDVLCEDPSSPDCWQPLPAPPSIAAGVAGEAGAATSRS